MAKKTLTLRIEPDIIDNFKAVCIENAQTQSGVIAKLMKRYTEDNNVKKV